MDKSKTVSPPQEKKIVGSTQTKNEQKSKGIVILRGITTSQINQALKTKNPYPARVFLKVDNQDQDIPVFFRKTIEPAMFNANTIDFHYSLGEFFNRLTTPIFFFRVEYSELLFNRLGWSNNTKIMNEVLIPSHFCLFKRSGEIDGSSEAIVVWEFKK